MRLPDTTMEAGAAIEFRVDDRAIAGPHGRAWAGFHDFADHLVAHDAGITHGNGAAIDLVVGSANPAVRHADQHLALADYGPRNFSQG